MAKTKVRGSGGAILHLDLELPVYAAQLASGQLEIIAEKPKPAPKSSDTED